MIRIKEAITLYRIFTFNPQLEPFRRDIALRMDLYRQATNLLLPKGGTLSDFANGHRYYGFHRVRGGWRYREWAPNAQQLYLTGDFNDWNLTSHPLRPLENGDWELFLEGEHALWEDCCVKTVVEADGNHMLRIPLYARYVVQDPQTRLFAARITDSRRRFRWTDKNFRPASQPLIYEAHVGMAPEDGHIGTYREFADQILPRIRESGYNTIQLMAIMEHPYYGSFGYQVSSFFAPSSRFGRPADLKYLINKAHRLGLTVLLDVVHSHATRNTAEGIHLFDGTVWQFFHDGAKGDHPAWGTKCFDYSRPGVLRFLLSNLRYWLEEFHFDGFRFDGVTSMMYHDHGLGVCFDRDEKYFSLNTHTEAITYLQLANTLIHQIKPEALTIAEDMSAMPGIALPIEDGGIGFDYRLFMGLPDMWIQTIDHVRDEDWDIDALWSRMCLRRPGEKTIAYVESHDQALVGDKTLIFRMADARMYTDMLKTCHTLEIDRAVALHKMIRLFTLAGGGDGYLNFMGNEFGHPEWIDFPREGNGWSHYYCRRQWSLLDNDDLKYRWLGDFDRDMIILSKESRLFSQTMADLRLLHNENKLIAFTRKDLLFAFNFHPEQSLTAVRISVPKAVSYAVVLCSDDCTYGGWDRVVHQIYPVKEEDGSFYTELYLPARTAIVLRQFG